MRRAFRGLSILLLAALLAGCAALQPLPAPAERILRKDLRWPVAGRLSSGYGPRSSGRHDGIDILAPSGTPALAAGRGTVAYAGNGLRGYGNAVILDHGDGVETLYGHLDSIRVKSADVVSADSVIGTVGRTGNATTDHLHFELRVDRAAVDPVEYLKR